jgi:hypothetical protein
LYQSASSFEDVSATDGLQMLLMHIRALLLYPCLIVSVLQGQGNT